MRVTTKMMTDTVMGKLFRQSEQLLRAQKKIATGKKVQRPSDDPVAMGKILDYRKTLASTAQYLDNVKLGKTRLDYSENVLNQATLLLNEGRNIAVNESGGTLETRQTAARQIEHIRAQLAQHANAKLVDDYLFAGHQTDRAPFAHQVEISGGVAADIEYGLAVDAAAVTIDVQDAAGNVVRSINGGAGTTGANSLAWNGLDGFGTALPDGVYSFRVTAADGGNPVVDYPTYKGDGGATRLIVGDNLELSMQSDGQTTFSDLFFRLAQLQQGLQNPDLTAGTAQISTTLVPLEAAADGIKQVRTVGAIGHKRLEATENQYRHLKLKTEDMLSDTEDADPAQAIVELQKLQTTYETTLATAARILQSSLINHLR